MKVARRITGCFALAFIGLVFLTGHQVDASGAPFGSSCGLFLWSSTGVEQRHGHLERSKSMSTVHTCPCGCKRTLGFMQRRIATKAADLGLFFPMLDRLVECIELNGTDTTR